MENSNKNSGFCCLEIFPGQLEKINLMNGRKLYDILRKIGRFFNNL
jgi:hypothetical protein